MFDYPISHGVDGDSEKILDKLLEAKQVLSSAKGKVDKSSRIYPLVETFHNQIIKLEAMLRRMEALWEKGDNDTLAKVENDFNELLDTVATKTFGLITNDELSEYRVSGYYKNELNSMLDKLTDLRSTAKHLAKEQDKVDASTLNFANPEDESEYVEVTTRSPKFQ
jgi:uncharacterized phage infection (PIP) family protein YhgE